MRLLLFLGIFFVLTIFCEDESTTKPDEETTTENLDQTTTVENPDVTTTVENLDETTTQGDGDLTTEASTDQPTTENPFDFEDDETEEEEINEIVTQEPIPDQTPIGEFVVEVKLEPLELDSDDEKELDDHKDDFIKFHKKFKQNIKKAKLKEAAKNFKANNKKLRAKRKLKKNFKLGMHPFMHLSDEKIQKLFMKKSQIVKQKKPKLKKVGNQRKTPKKAQPKKAQPKKAAQRAPPRAPAQKKRALKAAVLPKAFDWRTKNVLNAVKDQGSCGSCWTFSATVTVEANYAMKYKKKIDLSEQQLTCVYNESTICEGGFPDEALKYLQTHGGQTTEAAFPYSQAHKSTCKKVTPKALVASVGDLLPFGMAKVKQALIKNGPISFGMFVNDDFMNYEAGIFDSPCTAKDDGGHAMAIVGYGQEAGVPYWIVRNQWGRDWGENGHIRIKAGQNLCDIESWFMIQAKVK
ncbi:unnamed protein product, partial [Mesorhabditis belari]|uniref:Peptidase C1A papain C-terminal domain-containing protein n=1 Tax=Mesorhabditis belari TaxID=2138241 RepID=A0AAF3EPN9_9BILA